MSKEREAAALKETQSTMRDRFVIIRLLGVGPKYKGTGFESCALLSLCSMSNNTTKEEHGTS